MRPFSLNNNNLYFLIIVHNIHGYVEYVHVILFLNLDFYKYLQINSLYKYIVNCGLYSFYIKL